MKKINLPGWTIPIALFLLCFLSFGLLIPWLGFYWDDWFFVYSYHIFGPSGFGAFLAHDRPASQLFFSLVSFLFRDTPLGYQIFTFSLRGLTAVAIWWLVRSIWPNRADRLIWVPFLFVVYPGFLEQPIAFTYTVHWAGYLAVVVSMCLMIWAQRKPKWYWPLTAGALVLQTSIFSIEYHFGLELVRPLLLWFVFSESLAPRGKRLLVVLRHWLPYLPVAAGFVLWRIVLFKSTLFSPDVARQQLASPLTSLLTLVQTMLRDVYLTSWMTWSQTFDSLATLNFTARADWLYWGLILLAAVLTVFYFRFLRVAEPASTCDIRNPARQAVLLGIWAMLAAETPFIFGNFPHQMLFPYDRFALPYIFGVCFLFGGLLEGLVRTRWQKVVIITLLISFAVGTNFNILNTFRREWDNQGNFLWQLGWRAPAIQTGTTLLTYDLPFQYETDYSLTAPLNWMYAPQQKDANLPYLLYFIKSRLGTEGLQSLRPNTPVSKQMRSFSFTGSTSQTVLFFYSPPGCFRVLDPTRQEEWINMPTSLTDAGSLARPDLIKTQAADSVRPPMNYFNPEPAHQWCYYFEKADLARQAGRWTEVSSLGETALNLPQQAQDAGEFFVFIEGYARAGKLEQSNALTRMVLDKNPSLSPNLCALWSRLSDSPDVHQTAAQVLTRLGCGPK